MVGNPYWCPGGETQTPASAYISTFSAVNHFRKKNKSRFSAETSQPNNQHSFPPPSTFITFHIPPQHSMLLRYKALVNLAAHPYA